MNKQVFTLALCGTLLMGTGINVMAASKAETHTSQRWQRERGGVSRMTAGPDASWRYLNRLDLSEKQQAEVKKLVEARQEKTGELRQQMQEVHQKMRQAADPRSYNERELRRLSADKAKIRTELLVNRAATGSRIYALLTPEQKELADLAAKLRRLQGPGPRQGRGDFGPTKQHGPRRGR